MSLYLLDDLSDKLDESGGLKFSDASAYEHFNVLDGTVFQKMFNKRASRMQEQSCGLELLDIYLTR